jgi:hypothetical protein
MRILSYSYFVIRLVDGFGTGLNGSGDTGRQTKNQPCIFLVNPDSLVLLSRRQPWRWQHSGVFWGVFFFQKTSVGLFILWLFSRGKWKTVKHMTGIKRIKD